MTNPITLPNGTKEWKNENGQYHRDDGPAVIYPSGTKAWYKNGQLHRDDGHAVIFRDGTKHWYINDQLHRNDGPALIRPDGTQEWYIKGKAYSFKEWIKKVPNKLSIIWKYYEKPYHSS
jgi:hypothetical protein